MCWCEKTRLMFWGKLFMILFTVGAAVCIILAGVNFNLTFADFKENGWKSLAAVQIASIVYVFFVCAFGFFTFCCDNLCLTIIVSQIIFYKLVHYSYCNFNVIYFCNCNFWIGSWICY